MELTSKEYKEIAEKAIPPTKSFKTILYAFLVGGAICMLGEFLTELYKSGGMTQDSALTATSVSLIFLSALLTGLGLYQPIAKCAGAGTLVPITGFSNAMVSPALEYKSEGLVVGIGAKLFSIAGSVICYGLTAGVIYGLILFLFKLY